MQKRIAVGLVFLGVVVGLTIGAYWPIDTAQAQGAGDGRWVLGMPNGGDDDRNLNRIVWKLNTATGELFRCTTVSFPGSCQRVE